MYQNHYFNSITKQADILIAAIGRANFVKRNMVIKVYQLLMLELIVFKIIQRNQVIV